MTSSIGTGWPTRTIDDGTEPFVADRVEWGPAR